jgi:polyisoprenoid-binding protein YceI
VAAFPTVSFVSTGVAPEAGKTLVKGRFTLHGVTREIAVPVTIAEKGNVIEGRTSFWIKTSDYGIKPYSAFLGAVGNKDELQIHLKLVAAAR